MAQLPDGYTWTGDLGDTDIRALYAACHSLRFSGRLELRDGPSAAEVAFVAGEPVDIDGGDTQRIALWSRGTFRAVQSIPNLDGELTREREFTGSLKITKPSALWAWIGQFRLSCEIQIERPGQRAVVTFSNGHAESAQVNGAPELAALARVSSWTDGSFRVRLKPLFNDAVIPVPPPMPEGAPPAGPRQFDVSRSIPMDLRNKAEAPPPRPLATGRAGGAETPPPPKPPRARSETLQVDPTAFVIRPRRSRMGPLFWVASLALLVSASVLGLAWYQHWPPFSPPPKPLPDAPAVDARTEPAKTEAPKTGSTEKTGPTEKTDNPGKTAVAKNDPSESAEGETETEAKSGTPKRESPKDKAFDRMVLKARALLIEGHSHSALDLLHRAQKLRPKDASLRVYEQQAAGKLGRAELILDGKGSLTVDGHVFTAPKKLKVSAGPHLVDAGDGENELTLKRGEKKHVRVKR